MVSFATSNDYKTAELYSVAQYPLHRFRKAGGCLVVEYLPLHTDLGTRGGIFSLVRMLFVSMLVKVVINAILSLLLN